MRKLMSVLTATAVVAAAAVAMAQAKISQAEMEAAFKGKSFEDVWADGTKGVIAYGADGKTITYKNSKIDDKGTYRFAEGGYCSTWTIQRTTEKCFTASKLDGGSFQLWNTDGSKDDILNPM